MVAGIRATARQPAARSVVPISSPMPVTTPEDIQTAASPQAPAPEGGGPAIFQRLDTCAKAPYSRDEYIRRALWLVVHAVLVSWVPGRFVGWRRFWLRRFGARIDGTCNIRPGVRVRHPWLLEMGPYSTLGDRVDVYNLGQLTIGAHSVVSQNAHLCNGTHDYCDPSLPLQRPTMVIGSGVWICADAFIGPGVTIGDNTIVGARACVMRDLPAGVIASGNPAKVVKDRPMPRAGSEGDRR